MPDLAGKNILIVAPAAIEASLLARRLQRWGARTKIVPDEKVAAALLPEQSWSAVLVDHALGTAACEALVRMAVSVERRIVLVTPALRTELSALKEAGFTGYLIKPVRAASLAARFSADAAFEADAGTETVGTSDETRPSGGLAILVAEDNEINALLARALLEKLGHRPTIAASGADAIEVLAGRARRWRALRSRSHGSAHAGAWTVSKRRAASERWKPSTRLRARRSSRLPQMPPPRIATPVLMPAWTVFWSSRSIASG